MIFDYTKFCARTLDESWEHKVYSLERSRG